MAFRLRMYSIVAKTLQPPLTLTCANAAVCPSPIGRGAGGEGEFTAYTLSVSQNLSLPKFC